MRRGPRADVPAGLHERRLDSGVEPRLEMYSPAGGMQPRSGDRVGDSSPSSSTPARTCTRALRSRVPPAAPAATTTVPESASATRRHHARHPSARLELAAEQVGLAEHAVQVEVEAGEEVARAEAKAGCSTQTLLRVRDRQVRGVTVAGTVARERADEGESPVGWFEAT